MKNNNNQCTFKQVKKHKGVENKDYEKNGLLDFNILLDISLFLGEGCGVEMPESSSFIESSSSENVKYGLLLRKSDSGRC